MGYGGCRDKLSLLIFAPVVALGASVGLKVGYGGWGGG